MSPEKKQDWWWPKLGRWCKTARGGIVIAATLFSGVGGAVGFTVYKAKQIAEYLDLPGRAQRLEVQDSILMLLVNEAQKRDSVHDARIIYYFRAMHCIHDGYEDTSDFLDCPHFREELIAALAKAEGRAGPGGP